KKKKRMAHLHPIKKVEDSEVRRRNRDKLDLGVGSHLEVQQQQQQQESAIGGKENLTGSKETIEATAQNKEMTSIEKTRDKKVIEEAREFMQKQRPKKSVKKCISRFGDYRLMLTDIQKKQWWDQPEVFDVMEQLRRKEITMKETEEILGVPYTTLYGRFRMMKNNYKKEE
ncbi:unnamed protein product, partial [Meganyctiphanes norvegica]